MDPMQPPPGTGSRQPVPGPRGGPGPTPLPPVTVPGQAPPPGSGPAPYGGATPYGGGTEPSGRWPGRPEPARRRNRRLILLVSVGVVLALGIAGAGVAFFAYDRATRLDRSTPAVVLEQYVWSALYDLDNGRAKLFTCADPRLDEVAAMQREFRDRERTFGGKVTVDLANERVDVQGDRATVTVDLKVAQTTSAGVSAESVRAWTFGLRDESGWRVCTAHRLS